MARELRIRNVTPRYPATLRTAHEFGKGAQRASNDRTSSNFLNPTLFWRYARMRAAMAAPTPGSSGLAGDESPSDRRPLAADGMAAQVYAS